MWSQTHLHLLEVHPNTRHNLHIRTKDNAGNLISPSKHLVFRSRPGIRLAPLRQRVCRAPLYVYDADECLSPDDAGHYHIEIYVSCPQFQVTFIPKQDPAPKQTVVVVRCQADDLTGYFRALNAAQTSLGPRKIIRDFHPARAISFRMNWRTGRDVR